MMNSQIEFQMSGGCVQMDGCVFISIFIRVLCPFFIKILLELANLTVPRFAAGHLCETPRDLLWNIVYGLTNRYWNGHVWLRFVTIQARVLVFWNDDRITRTTNQMEIIVLFYFVLFYFLLVYFVCLIKHVFLIKYKETVSKNVDIVMKIDTFLRIREDRVQNQIYDYG